MADVVQCDNCGAILGADSEDEDLEALTWLKVGLRDSPPYDACTVACAQALLDGEVTDTLQGMLAVTAEDDE